MKPGEYGWVTAHMQGMYLEPVPVKVLAITNTGVHNVKVTTESGQVLYCRPDQIKSRPGKAERAAEPAIPEAVHQTAEKLAEQKIQRHKAGAAKTKEKDKPAAELQQKEKQEMEIITEAQAAERKERKKPIFEEVADAFVSLAKASDLEDKYPELTLVVELATEQVKIKYAGGWD